MQMNVYGGTQNSLMFPVMCDAYVNVDYSKNIAEEVTGIWDLEGSFTAEMIVTPYDVNGYGDNCNKASSVASVNNARGKQDSLKTMPATADNMASLQNPQDVIYLPTSARQNQQMVLFFNQNLEIALKNKSKSQQNQPAEYSILVNLKLGTTSQQLESPIVIKNRDRHHNVHAAHTTYLFDNFGAAFGNKVYISVNKEIPYIHSTYHIAFSFDNASKYMAIYCNGVLMASSIHAGTSDFVFSPSDIYLGQNPDAATPQLKRLSQFMGEYHEISVTDAVQTSFGSFYTLTPQFRSAVLYLDFEEVDE